MAGMEINLGFGGLTEAVNRLREMERLTGQIARNQAGGGGGGGAAAGPAARLAAAQRGVGPLATPEAVFDAQVRALRAQQSFDRAQRLLGGSTVGSRLMQAVSTSRFGAGGVMPLVGRTAAVLGGEAMAGPIGLAIAAVTGFAAVLHDATQTAGEFRRATTVTGGTAAQTAAISAMGIAPGQQAGAAGSLRETLATNAQAVMFSQRFLGIGVQMPRGFGEVNEAKGLQRFQERIRGLVDEGRAMDALRVARMFNLESLVEEAKVTRSIRDARDQDAAIQGRLMEQNAQVFRDFEAQAGRAATAFDNLKTSIAAGAAPGAGGALGSLADFMENLVRFREAQMDFMKRMREGLPDWLKGAIPETGPPVRDAQQKNTDALNENTRAMKQGIFGGGPLSQEAFPSSIRGPQVASAIERDRLKLGVF